MQQNVEPVRWDTLDKCRWLETITLSRDDCDKEEEKDYVDEKQKSSAESERLAVM